MRSELTKEWTIAFLRETAAHIEKYGWVADYAKDDVSTVGNRGFYRCSYYSDTNKPVPVRPLTDEEIERIRADQKGTP